MRNKPALKIEISLFTLTVMLAILACNFPLGLYSECEEVDRATYEEAASMLGETPESPKYPEGAVYRVCYTDNQLTSIRMTDGEKPDENYKIPAGTYTGTASFYTTLEDDAEFLDPVCSENTVRIVIGNDGTAKGEIHSFCFSNLDTDNEDMGQTHHSNVTGLIQGELLDNTSQLSIAYTWHSYFTSPQWETTSLDETVEFVFPYHVKVLDGVMTLTPAAEVEDYYSYSLQKE